VFLSFLEGLLGNGPKNLNIAVAVGLNRNTVRTLALAQEVFSEETHALIIRIVL
jgi:hypothetical protein